MHYSEIVKELEDIRNTFRLSLEETQKIMPLIRNEDEKIYFLVGFAQGKIDWLIHRIKNGE